MSERERVCKITISLSPSSLYAQAFKSKKHKQEMDLSVQEGAPIARQSKVEQSTCTQIRTHTNT